MADLTRHICKQQSADNTKKAGRAMYTLRVCMFAMLWGFTACAQADRGVEYFPLSNLSSEVVYSESVSFKVDTVLVDLERPWSMAFLPDNRVLVTTRNDGILIVKNGELQGNPLQGNVPEGLRDIELHFNYEENGWVYLSYYQEPSEEEGGYTILMRGRLDDDELVDDGVLYKAGPFDEGGGWYGSKIAFDHDGYMFFTVGIRDERQNAQDLSHHAGKTMRLYEDGSIPANNPFVDSSAALAEIYTLGHRMHEGLAVHPVTGDVWSHEHGEYGGDEINLLRPGLNYGWPEATYSLEYDGSLITEDTLRDGMEPPIHHWTPAIAPSGMDFVYGSRYPEWNGDLLSGSLIQRMVNRSVMDGYRVVSEEKLLADIGRVRNVTVAPDGFAYILTEDTGLLVRLVPVGV